MVTRKDADPVPRASACDARTSTPNSARDLAFALVLVYAVVPTFLPTLSKSSTILLLFLHALAWRAFHSFALGLALKKQSERRWIVRHFIKHYHYDRDGDVSRNPLLVGLGRAHSCWLSTLSPDFGWSRTRQAVRDAFDNWKAIYNLSLSMTYGERVQCWSPTRALSN